MSSTVAMSLAEELAKAVAHHKATFPTDAMAKIDAESAALATSFNLKPKTKGDVAPQFELKNALGKPVSLAQLLTDSKAVVLTWYRGSWCPYCNIALQSLTKLAPELKELGVALVALSPETPDESLTTAEKHNLPFQVLSDDGCEVAYKYGVAFEMAESLKTLYSSLGLGDMDAVNGNSKTRKASLPLPATFVLDKTGKIVFEFSSLDYTKRAEPSDILAAVKAALA